jgi:hypothetical protein
VSLSGNMTDAPHEPQPRPKPRRTVLVTSRWAASAAVIAAMTAGAGALDVNDDDQPTSANTSSIDNGPSDDGAADVD